jgi:hypothetical protein
MGYPIPTSRYQSAGQSLWPLMTLILVAAWVMFFRFPESAILEGDSGKIWATALNLYKFQTFSMTPTPPPIADNHLDPGLPFLLAGAIFIYGHISEMIPTVVNFAMLLSLAWAAFQVVARVSNSPIAGLIGGFIAATSWNATRYLNTALTETSVAAMFVWFLLGLFFMLEKQSLARALFLGMLGGALCLMRASFLYIEIGLGVGLVFFGLWKIGIRATFATAAFVVLGFCLLVGPWILRNIMMSDHAVTNARGGGVLTIRATYNQMNHDEWLAGFLYWNDDFRNLAPDDWEEGSATQRLNRRYDGGFLKTAKRKYVEYKTLFGVAEADRRLREDALVDILGNPGQHLKVSMLLAWRGVGNRWEANERYGKYWPGWTFLFFLALCYFAVRRFWLPLLLAIPVVGYICFYALMSHFIARYGMVLTPCFIIFVIIAVSDVLSIPRRMARR